MMKNIYKIMCVVGMTCTMTSCLDTIILPDDKTVDEDFWKTKGDVASMVNAAYSAMTSEDVLTRMIIWGDYRSDELVRSTSLSGSIPDALDEITAVGIQTTNQYATWAGFYDVINKCNIVLARAEAVQADNGGDPNYTVSDYEADRCQMLALRSLCYFYLVRNFRDVPYVTEAYMNSSQNRNVAQSSPRYVIDQIIQTLEEVAANPNCLKSNNYTTNEWRRVGWMTLDGVNTLLADCYLWRASVLGNAEDYQNCVDRCDMVIESKISQHPSTGRNNNLVFGYPLAVNTVVSSAYAQLYADQNAEESIFELQTGNNQGVFKYLYKYSGDNSSEGYLKAAGIFGGLASNPISPGSNVFCNYDLRYYSACFFDANSTESYHVRKMMSQTGVYSLKTESRASATDRTGSFNQNYIIYRLPDVMLMKAEAEVQLMQDVPTEATDEEKAAITEANRPTLQQAFNMVQAVNTRSLYSDNLSDSLKWNNFRNLSKTQMEEFVMQERLREFCFEGKRWYDLLRYAYRHMDGVQYDKTFGELVEAAGDKEVQLPAIYSEMLKLMTRSRGTDASAIQAKMHNEAYLYMPIPERDINVCPLLRQNPAYSSSSDYKKSY